MINPAGLTERQIRDEISRLYVELHAKLGNRPAVEACIRVYETELSRRLGLMLEETA